MIKTLQLKNFRQHTDLTLSFDQGVTVLRGANEAGKSTVFEAIAYALFGARATRNNELTTWGQPEGSHQVVLTFEIGGVEYTIKRNAKSAELNYDGGRVTGQTDTARFCEQLLDLKSGMGTKLMLVLQNEMRGTLSDGGAKTTAMIEQLADLGQIEEIITKLQTHWHTGKTDLIEHSLETFKQQHAEAREELTATENPEQALQDKLKGLRSEHYDLSVAESALKVVEQTAAEVSRYTEELKAARQANALLKALRTVKPQLANQVWQTVCSTVSHYFSLMRNQPSVVSKEAAGFAVDGHDTESLSGSTLDILGLAIRIALTKTFMPTCRFLLLDEPFAASDAERTAQALGFISSVGFDQVVIITHEDATEAVADNLITI